MEVSTSNMERIIGYFRTFHDRTLLTMLKVERYLATGHDYFCFLQHIFFIRGSTTLVVLVVLIFEFLRSHSLRHIALGRNPLDE
jgi:hypothetical protein